MRTLHSTRGITRALTRSPIATAVLLALGSPAIHAQDTTSLGEVIVTAQKRTESLQDVPISLDAIGEQKLEELNIQNFKDYVQFLPTVTASPSLGAGSGYNQVYMRGVATGGDGQATLSVPSVGTYVDEQPVTTVQGNLDVHLYDIARVEALAGPQGTLFGASSQAGTIRIITNKPDPSGFAAGYGLEANYVDMDDVGYVAEGFVNLPVGENAALRLVGWSVSSAGWMDNKFATRTYLVNQADPGDDFETSNEDYVADNYNTIDTLGARAALGINLGENWTVTPSVMFQTMEQEGSWGDDLNDVLASGSQAVAHFRDEYVDDEWYLAGVTVEGKIGSLDVVYSGNYLSRDTEGSFDYSDYSFWYDNAYTSGFFGNLFFDNDGNQLNPDASYTKDDYYSKSSHELRISTPQDKRVRGLLGFFLQKQYHDFKESFGNIEGLADVMSLNRDDPDEAQYPGVVYLNRMDRTDRDQAVFAQVAFDVTDTLEMSLGARYFEPEVTLKGFFGFGIGFTEAGWSGTGENQCNVIGVGQEARKDMPCFNVNKRIKEDDSVYRANLSWDASDTTLLYATWSEGYRPGGVQRNPFADNYVADFLTNYELGWKTRFADDRLQFNGAVFLNEWDEIQIAFQGANGITQVANGPDAEIRGVEAQLDWLPTDSLRLGMSVAYYDTELKDDYCDQDDLGNCVNLLAPAGTALPVTPDLKGNLIARYSFGLGGFDSFMQGAVGYQSSRASILNVNHNELYGDIPSSTFLDLSFGLSNDKYSVELFLANATDEDAPIYVSSQCEPGTCGVQPKAVQYRPRTIGIRFSQDF
ncbi:MAG: TonB-dependent receptor [Pseudomonadota bacterium]|nr:TonB-dependent receptor [Pseudomonadota bacterium]